MAGKRKLHTKTDISVPKVEHTRNRDGTVTIAIEDIPPADTVVRFPHNPNSARSFDFAPFYGHGIDEVTYACQRQIERFLAKQDGEREAATVVNYARSGLNTFLPYLMLRSSALGRRIALDDIGRELIDGYIQNLADVGVARDSQRAHYNSTKSVLIALGKRNLISLVHAGDERTFPKNPYPNTDRQHKGEKPLTRIQRQSFTAAVKTAVMPLFQEDVDVTGDLLAYALLIVALHTGRNTTPLLEMTPECLRPHPKENTFFLILWKRRGYNSSKVVLQADTELRGIESMPGVKWPVVRLIQRVIELTAPLRADAPPHLAGRIWLYRSQANRDHGKVTTLTNGAINLAAKKLADEFSLRDANQGPLRVNVSRLRKTFANRIFEILDGNLASTAVALGNTPKVAERNYLAPGEESQKNWKFMGAILTNELLSKTLGSTERTPSGSCTDPTNGQYAPKKDGSLCFSFLDCLRCRNYVVTGDDLYKLFSFYWRVLQERDRMSTRLWSRHYAHIPRLIERDVIAKGIKQKIFKADAVNSARERARIDPHPYWRTDSLSTLEIFRSSLPGDAA